MPFIRTLEELESLAPLWNTLTEDKGEGTVHSVFPWLNTWWRTYLELRDAFTGSFDLLVITIKDANKNTTGIAPLMLECNGEQKTIRFLGEGVSDFADFLVWGDRYDFFHQCLSLLDKTCKGADVELQQFPKNSPNYAPLMSVLKEKGYAFRESVIEKCPYLSISDGWEDYYASVSNKHRYDIRRCKRRLEEQGKLSFTRFNVVDQKHIDEFSQINIQRQRSLNRPSLYENPFKHKFVMAVSRKLNDIGMMDAAALFHNDRMISYVYGFCYRRIHYYWNISFLPEYARYSPGKILLYHLLSDSFKKGYRKFDFMRGDEKYKFIWARAYRTNLRLNFKIAR